MNKNVDTTSGQGISDIRSVKWGSTVGILKYLKHSIASAYGPKARSKLIGSYQHDEIKYGSSSTLLFNSALVDIDDEIIKLIVSCIKEHLKVHYDHGLYCALVSFTLVEFGLSLNLNSCLVAECFRCFLKRLSLHLSDPKACSIVQAVDVSKINLLLQLIKNILLSKPVLCLKNVCENISMLLLKAYLNCLPSDTKESTIVWPSIVFLHNSTYEESKIYNGFLMDLHHCSRQDVEELFFGKEVTSDVNVVLFNLSLTIDDFIKAISNNAEVITRVAKASILTQLEKFSEKLQELDISVLINQRIISDQIKSIFQHYGIIVIDRIGLEQMNTLKRMLNATVFTALHEDVETFKCQINGLAVETISKKAFVHVTACDTNFSTLLIGYPNVSTVNDLKHVCWASLHMLDQTINEKLVIEGASNMEQYLISYANSILTSHELLKEEISCSKAQHDQCLQCFCSCLSFVSNLHPATNRVVFDCYQSKVNAFVVAVEAACIALEIKYQIRID